ncbi:ribonuclease H2 subunit B [Sinocyclocheilus grahami]|uniref:Ribonuclease H2 subunit B n=1 Tax=Sinocyclocheilus grahami TaxID=75366 RepID=A0A672RLD7_SINGR|nr:PREDICTED: ribonuclease H2 subunit B-like [Sinocyclocheilus grahami]
MTTKKKRSARSDNDSWVVIAPDSALDTGRSEEGDPSFIKLKNPATGSSSLYLFGCGDVCVYEVKAFSEDFRSWFSGQTVQRDGRLLYVTPIDPLFLLLPYISSTATEEKFQPAKQMIMDEDYPGCTRLLHCKQGLDSLHHVADEKEVEGKRFHRYNQEKTLEWLKKKVQRTVLRLKKSNMSVGGGVKSSMFVRVKHEDATEEDYLRYAHGLISEYISEDLSKALLKHLQLPEIFSPKETEPPSKKRKLSDKPVEAGEDYTKFNSADFARKPPKKMTAAQKSLAKVDKTGMKSLSAFFSPKDKQEQN